MCAPIAGGSPHGVVMRNEDERIGCLDMVALCALPHGDGDLFALGGGDKLVIDGSGWGTVCVVTSARLSNFRSSGQCRDDQQGAQDE